MCPNSQAAISSDAIRGEALDVATDRSYGRVRPHYQSQLPHTPVTDSCIPQAQRPPSLRTS